MNLFKEEAKSFFLFLFILTLTIHSFLYLQEKDKWQSITIEMKTIKEEPVVSKGFFVSYTIGIYQLLFEKGGNSESGGKANDLLWEKVGPTFILAVCSALPFSIAALYMPVYLLKNNFARLREFLNWICQAILSTPIFVVGILLIILFFYKFQILPPGGFDGFHPGTGFCHLLH